MMIMCNGAISADQISYLQAFKQAPADVNYKMAAYADLIAIDFEALKFVSANPDMLIDGEGSGPVDMTSQEIMMSNEVEEYSDDLKRESDDDMRAGLGKTQIAFIDIENMSTGARIFCFVAIFGVILAILKFFHGELVVQEGDVNVDRKEKLRQRKMKKGQ